MSGTAPLIETESPAAPDVARPARRPRRVVHLPVYRDNPYQPMLMEAQRELGWEVIDGGGGGNFLGTALRDWRADVLHFHWLHPYLLRDGVAASWGRGLRFLAEVALLKSRGTRVVWTVHNLSNHEGRHPRIELALTRRFVRLCDAVVVHGAAAADAARVRFRVPASVPVVNIPHPHYADRLPPAVPRDEARRRLGLTDAGRVFLFLGRVRPYKCVDELLAAFAALPAADARLIVAGGCEDETLGAELHRLAAPDPRVRLDLRHVPDDEVPVLMGAADVIACPSRGVLTSGSVLLAMSFGRPVVAPAAGCVPEVVGGAGFLYEAGGLAERLNHALRSDADALNHRGACGRRRAGAADPADVARRLIAEYAVEAHR